MVSKYIKISLTVILILGVLGPIIFFSFNKNPSRDIEIDLWYTYEGGDVITSKVAAFMEECISERVLPMPGKLKPADWFNARDALVRGNVHNGRAADDRPGKRTQSS